MYLFVIKYIAFPLITSFKNFKLEPDGNVPIYTNQNISQRMQVI